MQDLVPPSWDIEDDTLDNDFISYDDLLRDVRDYADVLDFTANAPASHENASGVSADPQVQELVDQIRDLTRRDLLTPGAPSPGAASPAEPLPGQLGLYTNTETPDTAHQLDAEAVAAEVAYTWSVSTIGVGGDTTILFPGRSPKQPLPGIGLHDPLHGRQACPKLNSFHEGVGQISPRKGLF